MSPLVGVVGETGDVLAIRARGGNASPKRKLNSFIEGEARALLVLAIGVDIGRIGIDREPTRCGGSSHRPGPAQHVAVRRLCALHPPEICPGKEAEQRRVARKSVTGAKLERGLVPKERNVGEEVPATELSLDERAVALAAGVSTRADRPEIVRIGGLDETEAIEKLAEQRQTGDSGDVVLARLDGNGCHPACGPRRGDGDVLDRERERSSLHLVGAPFAGQCVFVVIHIIPGRGALSASFTPP